MIELSLSLFFPRILYRIRDVLDEERTGNEMDECGRLSRCGEEMDNLGARGGIDQSSIRSSTDFLLFLLSRSYLHGTKDLLNRLRSSVSDPAHKSVCLLNEKYCLNINIIL